MSCAMMSMGWNERLHEYARHDVTLLGCSGDMEMMNIADMISMILPGTPIPGS